MNTEGEAKSTTWEDQIAAFDPTNPESLAALEKSVLGATTELTVDHDPMNGSGLKSAADEIAAAAEKQGEIAKQDEKNADETALASATPAVGEPSVTPSPKGVQAKDGQHIIPYSVLERERDRAARAEQTAQALAEQLQKLQAGDKAAALDAGNTGKLTDDDLAKLDQDLPEVAKAIRSQMAMIDTLVGTVTTLQQEQEVAHQTRAASVQDEIQAAIAGNADLKAWQEQSSRAEKPDPRMWNRAADIDAQLREDPDWKDKPIAERFAKVVEVVRVLSGTPAPVTTEQKQQQPDLKALADAKLKAAPAPVPTTLSDIPGGAPPSQSDIETLSNASAIALGNKFLTMTSDQIDAYLARSAA